MIFNASQLPDGTNNKWTKHNWRITLSQRLFHKENAPPKKKICNDKEKNVTYTHNSSQINKYIIFETKPAC